MNPKFLRKKIELFESLYPTEAHFPLTSSSTTYLEGLSVHVARLRLRQRTQASRAFSLVTESFPASRRVAVKLC